MSNMRDQDSTEAQLERAYGKRLLIFAGIIALLLFVFVNKTVLLGQECYHVGQFSMQSKCIAPWVIKLGWIMSVACALYGVFKFNKFKT